MSNVLFHCEPAVSKVEVYLQGGHVKKWPFCLEDRMERQRWHCQGQITKATVSEMAICDSREVPVEADRVCSKTQSGNYLLQRPHANTGLPGSNGSSNYLCNKGRKQIFLPMLPIPSGWGGFAHWKRSWCIIYPSWILIFNQFLLFSIIGMFIAAARQATRTRTSTQYGSQAINIFH